jgi:signal transduction histidine kinase
VEWVTALKSRYRQDPFFRTEWSVIFLQIIFAICLLALVTIAFNYLYKEVASTLLNGILEAVRTEGANLSDDGILNSAKAIKTQHLIVVFFSSALITAIFGYIIARIALKPARNALNTQKRFVSDIAHELRTPLSVIKTNSEVALMDKNLDPNVRKTLKSNIEELNRTSEIINNLLSLKNLMSPERISFVDVDLGDIVETAAQKLHNLAHKKQIELTIKKTGPRIVCGNSTALEQIVINLLKNAVHYTPPGGNITVTVGPDYEGNISLVVQDNGVGISENDLLHIFEPFYRSEQSRNRHFGSSSGLGLTIVSELVKIHSGRVTIKSAPNRGTTVMVLIPQIKQSGASIERRKLSQISADFLQKRRH